jgi:hypothetical protein
MQEPSGTWDGFTRAGKEADDQFFAMQDHLSGQAGLGKPPREPEPGGPGYGTWRLDGQPVPEAPPVAHGQEAATPAGGKPAGGKPAAGGTGASPFAGPGNRLDGRPAAAVGESVPAAGSGRG